MEATKQKFNLFVEKSSNELEQEEEGEDYDGVDLQLSLGPSKKLRRSSSICMVEGGGSSNYAVAAAVETHAPLGRTCSLPAVSEEEFRRRKQEQSARRLEARKKRLEKKNRGGGGSGGGCGGGSGGGCGGGSGGGAVKEKEKESSSEDGSNTNINNNINKNNNINNGVVENGGVVERSIGSSQRTGSSGVCDPPSQLTEAQNTEVRSPPTARPVQVQAPQEPQGRPPIPADRNVNGKRTIADMPYVVTREGNRIEGFLYRYRKGEEVKIVCVCHGLFLSPAEFVKHGGGGDVENPLRHIVVSPSPPLV